jgi:hypothetical protein
MCKRRLWKRASLSVRALLEEGSFTGDSEKQRELWKWSISMGAL